MAFWDSTGWSRSGKQGAFSPNVRIAQLFRKSRSWRDLSSEVPQRITPLVPYILSLNGSDKDTVNIYGSLRKPQWCGWETMVKSIRTVTPQLHWQLPPNHWIRTNPRATASGTTCRVSDKIADFRKCESFMIHADITSIMYINENPAMSIKIQWFCFGYGKPRFMVNSG